MINFIYMLDAEFNAGPYDVTVDTSDINVQYDADDYAVTLENEINITVELDD